MILILYIVLFAGSWIAFHWLKNKRIRLRQVKDFEQIFLGSPIKLPTLKIATRYWYPTFAITFWTKADREFAEHNGLIAQFKERIKTYYNKEFDPNKAISCKHLY